MSNKIAQWVKAASFDGSQWNMLYKTYYPGMFSIALRICGDKEIATDAVQDAFITAYLKISQLKEPEKFGGWMKQIVMHTCYRALSVNKKHASIENISPDSKHFFDDVINKTIDDLDKENKFFGALATLPEALNTTILLRYFSNYQSYEEIATILGIPVGTVRSRLNQAKIKLTEFWRQREDVDNSFFQESEEWNAYYHDTYGGMHRHDNLKDTFVRHVSSSSILSPQGASVVSGKIFDSMVIQDREAGSWLKPVNVFTSSNISVIEAKHYNSIDNPDHCPDQSVIVVYRDGRNASKIYVHAPKK